VKGGIRVKKRELNLFKIFKEEFSKDYFEVDQKEYKFLLDSIRYLNVIVNQLLYTEDSLTEEDYKKLNDIRDNKFDIVV
jgi:hypothetical protein